MDSKLFISITISLSLIIFVVFIYIIYMLFKIRTLNIQIERHIKIYNIALFVLLTGVSRGLISLFMFVVMLLEVGYAIYLNEKFNKLTKQLVKIMEDERKCKTGI